MVFLWRIILFVFRCCKQCTSLFRKKKLCPLWSLALVKKSCNNIDNSRRQVSRLCHFLWLWTNLYAALKQFLFFYKFYDFFCRQHSLMNQPRYNNLFRFMQHSNFRNLYRVIFTHWKHLEPWVNAFWYAFQ